MDYMTSAEKAKIEKSRKELSIKSMYFNRYLLVRYVTAIFFFTNVYWLISLLLSDSSLYFIPLSLLIMLLASTAEQVKIYGRHVNDAKHTRYSFTTLLFTNVSLIFMTFFSSSFTHLYPFLVNQDTSRHLVLSILVAGILISALILNRLKKIKHNEDKQYARIKQYEKLIH